jgi:sugar phosphate isomerase/epimerase
MSKLALSTSWNIARHKDAQSLIQEIKLIGFNKLELNFTLTREMVEGVALLQKKGEIEVVSLHNYCPMPEGLGQKTVFPDHYSLASLDEAERKEAVRYTKISIDTARRLDAKVVVFHAGRVQMPDRTVDLIKLYSAGKKDEPAYNKIKDSFIKERALKIQPHLEQILRSIDELERYAAKCKVYLGLENRFYYREIPNYEEIGIILNKFKKSRLFYWHDVGHAQVMQELGFYNHIDFLNKYKDRLIGFHLHDLVGCRDHLAPSSGRFDFKILVPFIKRNTLKVIEAHAQASVGEVIRAKEYLEKILNV